MAPLQRRLLSLATAVLFVAAAAVLRPPAEEPSPFAATIARLSEPGGYFDTNNLISNEKSYLHVIPDLREPGLKGGVYLGVGPDQNFSYIAHAQPSMAFIIDVRRDNLLLHLLFKALFRLSANRVQYLGLLLGRVLPAPDGRWGSADIEQVVSYVEAAARSESAAAAARAKAAGAIKRFGVPLSDGDWATIDRFHRTFIARGLDLQFESAGRAPRSYYPTYRELLLETDPAGRRRNYLASEADFQFVKSLQERDLVIPVVGDVAGRTAMPAIARHLESHGARLSVFYTSNVEYYLANTGAFERFTANLARLPRTGKSLIVRSLFPGRFGRASTTPGYYSASVVQRVDDLLDGVAKGRIRGYQDLLDGR